ncbi:MAG TPA: YihY/virulence factor BrkB family protein [Hyphomicrobiales bacterium]|nr:YihY/virulence factor BrkB family protein [Hyphomicrobiales bacterium]
MARASSWFLLGLGTLYIAFAGRALAGPRSIAAVGAAPATPPHASSNVAADTGDDRGRQAASPGEIPPRGWKEVLKRTVSEFSDDRILSVAAGVTFYVLLAIFPAIAALISIYGFFADPTAMSSQLAHLAGVLPGGAMDVVGDQMKRVAAQKPSSLGVGFVIGLVVALWSASSGIKALFDALNVAYEEKEKRGFIRLSAIALLVTLGALAFALVAIGAVVVLPIVFNFIGFGSLSATLMNVVRWPALLVIMALALAVLFRFGPSRASARWRWVSWGSALAAVLWVGGSLLFSWYVANFGSYNKTYGSLGAVIGFMTWIWLSTTVILLGAELNCELERQTARDSTTEGGRPLGSRGAVAADTVAGPQD